MINFHRKTGLRPGYSVSIERYGIGTTLVVRVGWSALAFTKMHKSCAA